MLDIIAINRLILVNAPREQQKMLSSNKITLSLGLFAQLEKAICR